MRKSIALATAAFGTVFSMTSMASSFINGGFEDGNFNGWTYGTGYRAYIDNPSLNPADFLPGGSQYIAGLQHSAVVTGGTMAHTDGTLNQVFDGTYSMRLEDLTIGGYASAVQQKVTNYTDDHIYFAWAATLEGAHGPDDAATFILTLHDDTTNTDLIRREYNAASGGGGVDNRFALSSDNFYYTKSWQTESLDIDSSLFGHDFSLTLLAADCEPTGHEGTVYLDGFGGNLPAVPEPETYALMLAGLGVMGLARRRVSRKG